MAKVTDSTKRSLRDEVRLITNELDYQLMRWEGSPENSSVLEKILELQVRLNKRIDKDTGMANGLL